MYRAVNSASFILSHNVYANVFHTRHFIAVIRSLPARSSSFYDVAKSSTKCSAFSWPAQKSLVVSTFSSSTKSISIKLSRDPSFEHTLMLTSVCDVKDCASLSTKFAGAGAEQYPASSMLIPEDPCCSTSSASSSEHVSDTWQSTDMTSWLSTSSEGSALWLVKGQPCPEIWLVISVYP